MNKRCLVSSLCCLLVLSSAASTSTAQGSLRASGNASAASAASMAVVSIATASVAVLTVHAGTSMVVESIHAIGNAIEVVFRGSSTPDRATIKLTATAVNGVGLKTGQTVKVTPKGSGYLLTRAGKVLCYVPGEGDRQLVRSRRSS